MASRKRRVLYGIVGVVVALAAVWGGLALVFDLAFLPRKRDMWPGLGQGAIVVINRRATPQRGDVVVLDKKSKDGQVVVSRVVAVPGDRVAFIDSRPFVDGVKVEWQEVGYTVIDQRDAIVWRETLGARSYLVLDMVNRRMQALFSQPVKGYWVLEDNREHIGGTDSRTLGELRREDIRGVVAYVVSRGDLPYVRPSVPQDAGMADASSEADAGAESAPAASDAAP